MGVGVGIRRWTVDGLSWRSGAGLVVLVGGLGLVVLALRRLGLGGGPVRRLVVSIVFLVAVAVAVWTLTPAVIATFVPPFLPGLKPRRLRNDGRLTTRTFSRREPPRLDGSIRTGRTEVRGEGG